MTETARIEFLANIKPGAYVTIITIEEFKYSGIVDCVDKDKVIIKGAAIDFVKDGHGKWRIDILYDETVIEIEGIASHTVYQ